MIRHLVIFSILYIDLVFSSLNRLIYNTKMHIMCINCFVQLQTDRAKKMLFVRLNIWNVGCLAVLINVVDCDVLRRRRLARSLHIDWCCSVVRLETGQISLCVLKINNLKLWKTVCLSRVWDPLHVKFVYLEIFNCNQLSHAIRLDSDWMVSVSVII